MWVGRSMLTVADMVRGWGKIGQHLADVICERSLMRSRSDKNKHKRQTSRTIK